MGIGMTCRLNFGHLLTLVCLLVICSACAETHKYGESQPVALTDTQTAISKLAFLVGNWSGPGTSYGADGTKTRYHDTEFVRFDLDKNLLLINARGENMDGETTYSLHTVIHYDAEAQSYVYTPYSGKRPPRSFNCTLNDQPQFICLTQDQSYRLTFQRLPDGRWNEFGEKLQGERWVKNFETILSSQ